MNGPPSGFWAKLANRDGKTGEWHPLVDHCADVAACVEALLQQPTWQRRLAQLCSPCDLDEVTIARLCVLGALHDLGKFNIGFQAKGRPDLGLTGGHVKEAVAWIDRGRIGAVAELGAWGEGALGLLVASVCHHGRPYPITFPPAFEPVLWQPRGGLDPMHGIAELVAACKRWFPPAFDPAAKGNLPCTLAFEHAFAGLVMLADWMGSDQRYFPFSRDGDGERLSFSRHQARELLEGAWISIGADRRDDQATTPPFTRVAQPGQAARPAQSALVQLPTPQAGSITILEAETGSGKTEAALAHFVQLFSKGEVDGLYFALPTRTAATEIHRRVVSAIGHAFGDPPPVVLAVPGYLRVDESEGQRLAPFDVLWPDSQSERFRYRAWAAEMPKRFLAACVAIGTIDQALLSAVRVNHAHLRATALLRQLLVVDEVHASDAYMTSILEEVLARHRAAGGHALLLSATLGAETRERLLWPSARRLPPTMSEALACPYPLISRSPDARVVSVANATLMQKVVSVETRSWLETPEAVAQAALEAAAQGAKVLVIKNTVTDCIATQQAVEVLAEAQGRSGLLFRCCGFAAPHHSRYCRDDRVALDDAIRERFGLERVPGGCVVIATQTVQQSLDIDADVLLSDLAPMDVLLQRVGRLHRHVRDRPKGFERARVMIVVPAERDLGDLLNDQGKARHHHGLGTVYPDLRILEATWRQIEAHPEWRIPDMCRLLVEGSLHSASLAAVVPATNTYWQQHGIRCDGQVRGAQRQAELNLVDWSRPYSETSFPEGERIMTRLGEGDRRVRFEPAQLSPFGLRLQELTLPERWVRGVAPEETDAHSVTRTGEVLLFRFAALSFRYDRHGVLRVSKPGSADNDDGQV